jgi:hypothetical protein
MRFAYYSSISYLFYLVWTRYLAQFYGSVAVSSDSVNCNSISKNVHLRYVRTANKIHRWAHQSFGVQMLLAYRASWRTTKIDHVQIFAWKHENIHIYSKECSTDLFPLTTVLLQYNFQHALQSVWTEDTNQHNYVKGHTSSFPVSGKAAIHFSWVTSSSPLTFLRTINLRQRSSARDSRL